MQRKRQVNAIKEEVMLKKNMWHSIGKGPIWSFLETEILRKIGEMVKKSKWSISVVAVYSEHKAVQKQVSYSQEV